MAETIYRAPERVDRLNASAVQKELDKLLNDGANELVFDMTDLKYISSAGLRVLLAAQQRIGDNGSFHLANVPREVKELLDVTGFSAFMKVKA